MYYYIYKITCLKGSLTDHYYIGQHRTNKLNDNYTGSGKIINNYFNKYGKLLNETYEKEILSFHNSLEELNDAEIKAVGLLYKNDSKCLNLKAGGDANGISEEMHNTLSASHIGNHHTDISKQKISVNNCMKTPEVAKIVGQKLKDIFKGRKLSDETKKKISDSLKGKTGRIPWNKGIKLSEDTKAKLKGRIPWNKGKELSDDIKKKLSEKKIGNKNASGHTVTNEARKKMAHWTGYHWKKDPLTGKRIFFKYD